MDSSWNAGFSSSVEATVIKGITGDWQSVLFFDNPVENQITSVWGAKKVFENKLSTLLCILLVLLAIVAFFARTCTNGKNSNCKSKIQRFLIKPVKFIIIYDTKRISFFVSNKDKLPPLSRNNLVYQVSCPGCGKSYIGMTKRCLSVRLKEHATQVNNSPIGKHFSDCERAQHLANLQNQFSLLNASLFLLVTFLLLLKA